MKVKGTGSRMASNPEQEPNFYLMAHMPASNTDKYEDKSNHTLPSVGCAKTDDIPSATFSSSLDDERGPHKVISVDTQLSDIQKCPEDTQKDDSDQDMDDLNFVFDNMPFHELNGSEGSRRHSLVDIQRARRLSAQFARRRNSLRNSFMSIKSLVISDDDFEKEMEAICQLGENVSSDQEMSGIIDKIIDNHRMI